LTLGGGLLASITEAHAAVFAADAACCCATAPTIWALADILAFLRCSLWLTASDHLCAMGFAFYKRHFAGLNFFRDHCTFGEEGRYQVLVGPKCWHTDCHCIVEAFYTSNLYFRIALREIGIAIGNSGLRLLNELCVPFGDFLCMLLGFDALSNSTAAQRKRPRQNEDGPSPNPNSTMLNGVHQIPGALAFGDRCSKQTNHLCWGRQEIRDQTGR
jgi:hypothetical protein